MLKEYYRILEVPFTASFDDIKANYRTLAKKYHPDLNNGSKASEEKFKELQEAYYNLSDPEKRRAYDDKMGFSSSFGANDTQHRTGTSQDNEGLHGEPVPKFFFDDFLGQEKIIANLKVFVAAAKKRGETLEHTLITGEPGTGKSTLAYAIATELQEQSRVVHAHDILNLGDLCGILTNLQERDVLIMESFERLKPQVLEYLSSAISTFQIPIMVDSGPSARSIQLSLPRFTLIAIVNDKARFKPKHRTLFGITCNLDYLPSSTLEQVIAKFARSNNIVIDSEGTALIASYCHNSSKEAFHLLKRVRDFSEVYSNGKITKDITYYALQAMGVN